jgi:hypothetical protein
VTKTAPCDHCKTPTDYHGIRTAALLLCPACDKAFKQPDCHDCGGPSAVVFEDCDDASGYRGEEGLCLECLAKREARA